MRQATDQDGLIYCTQLPCEKPDIEESAMHAPSSIEPSQSGDNPGNSEQHNTEPEIQGSEHINVSQQDTATHLLQAGVAVNIEQAYVSLQDAQTSLKEKI